MLVQAFISKPPVEALDVAVVHWFSRPDEGKAYAAPVRPGIEHLALELGPVVYGDRGGEPSDLGPALGPSAHAGPTNGSSNPQHHSLTGGIMYNREQPKLPR